MLGTDNARPTRTQAASGLTVRAKINRIRRHSKRARVSASVQQVTAAAPPGAAPSIAYGMPQAYR